MTDLHNYAETNCGNAIYINPEVTGTFKPSIFDRVRFIKTYIEPLFEEVAR